MASSLGMLGGLLFSVAANCAELSVNYVTAGSGSVALIEVRLTSSGSSISALQFELIANTGAPVATDAGAAALLGAKSLHSAALGDGGFRYLIAGINRNTLVDGVVALIGLALPAATADGSYPLRLTNAIASDPEGSAVPLTTADGRLTVDSSLAIRSSVMGTVPQIVSGGAWKTGLILVNPLSLEVTATVAFFDYSGTPQAFPLTYPADIGLPAMTASAVDLVIPANGSIVVETEAPQKAEPQVGWARVQASAEISGSAVFRQLTGNGQSQAAVVPLETRNAAAYVLPFDNTAGSLTGAALVNASDVGPVDVAVIARDADGSEAYLDGMTLPIRGHIYFSTVERYTSLSGRQGTLEFRAGAGNSIAVLGLQFRPDASFISIPVTAK